MNLEISTVRFVVKTQNIQNNEQPDLDLPAGCSWRQTDRGEVFFANDLSKSTSWIHPRVEQQLLKQKVCAKMFFIFLNILYIFKNANIQSKK